MPSYLFLIYEAEAPYADMSPEHWEDMMDAHRTFTAAVGEAGATVVGGEALQPTATATSVRGGQVSDGPFVETKEALGGYYVVEAADLDEALALAALCPAPHGGIEVRPVMDTGS